MIRRALTNTGWLMGARGVNAVLSLGYTRTEPLLVGERAIGQTTTNSATGATRGSTTTVPARIGTVTLAGGTPLLPAAPNTPLCTNSLGAQVACDGTRINPTTGFLMYVPKSEIVELEMSIEEGAKLIISAGLVAPEYIPANGQAAPIAGVPVPTTLAAAAGAQPALSSRTASSRPKR